MVSPWLSAISIFFTRFSHASTIAVARAAVNGLSRDLSLTDDFAPWFDALEPSPEGPAVFFAVSLFVGAGGVLADEAAALILSLCCNHRGGRVFGSLIDGIIFDFLQGPAASQVGDILSGHES